LVVRRISSEEGYHKVVGPAHVSGVMNGEAMRQRRLAVRKYVLL
jgi:hypothetical protein